MSKRTSWKNTFILAKSLLAANSSAPSSVYNALRYALRIYLFHPHLIHQLEEFFQANEFRRTLWTNEEFKRDVYFQQIRRCFYKKSSSQERWQYLDNHFNLIENSHSAEVVKEIYWPNLNGCESIVLHEGDNKLSVKLMYHHDLIREGFLWWAVELNDKIIFKLTFWLMDYQGTPSLCISALQGGKESLEDNRDFTKYFYGVRPQNFAMLVVRWYAEALGIKQILSFPIENMWSKKIKDREAVKSFLQEQGAETISNSPFVRLALYEQRKAMEEIQSKKRSQYKKRFDFIDQTKTLFQENIRTYFSTKARSIT